VKYGNKHNPINWGKFKQKIYYLKLIKEITVEHKSKSLCWSLVGTLAMKIVAGAPS
jgi:hypothetical protein